MGRALRVAIVGGGIGGVAAANALLQRDIDVRVYEQAPELKEVGAGVALHPNGVRMLRRLGFREEVARYGARWKDPQFRHPDGRLVARWWRPEDAERYEIFGIHRADLLQLLVDRLPATIIHTNHRCVTFSQTAHECRLEFANGERATSDVVVGADGIHSTLQPYVTDPPPPIYSGSVAYRGIISAESVGWPPGTMRNWLGPGKHFLVFPVRANQLVNYVGFVKNDTLIKESWSAPGDPAALAREFAGWNPTVENIIAQIQTCFWWGLYDREPLPRWTNGRLTLLGDAAHPMLPHVGQGANQAIEDGVVLAALLRGATPETAAEALAGYERARRERAAEVQRSSRRNGARYDASSPDLRDRDSQLSNQGRDRAWMWEYDALAEAETLL